MKKNLLIVLLLSIRLSGQNDNKVYDFMTIYNKDSEILKKITLPIKEREEIKQLTTFKKYTIINPEQYKHTSFTIGNHHIDKWISKTNKIKCITKIVSLVNNNPKDSLKSTTPLKFITYRFENKNMKNKQLYISVDSQGLIRYSVNIKEFTITHVFILEALPYYMNSTLAEIKELLNKY